MTDRILERAQQHRRRWSTIPSESRRAIVAITGSSGKSTTRRVVSSILRTALSAEVVENAAERTSPRDLAQCLLSLRPETAACVLEVPAAARGDLARLGAMIEPDFGVLTLIDLAHSDRLGTLDEIAREKGDLLRASRIAVHNADDARACREARGLDAVSFGFDRRASYRLLFRGTRGLAGSLISVARPVSVPLAIEAPVFGDGGARAVAAALAVCEQILGASLDLATIRRALDELGDEQARFTPRALGDGTLLLFDGADATPASMRSAIEIARELATHERRRLVIAAGAMGSLGRASLGAHTAVGVACARAEADAVVICGAEAAPIGIAALAHGVPTVFARTRDEAARALDSVVRPGDFVLLAGGHEAPMRFLAAVLSDRAMRLAASAA